MLNYYCLEEMGLDHVRSMLVGDCGHHHLGMLSVILRGNGIATLNAKVS